MNMFKAFESRVASAFGASQQGITMPFSFRKLAKRATREMEQETFVVDGVNTAPALITILVSADDDSIIKPLYPELAAEVADLIEGRRDPSSVALTPSVALPLARWFPCLRSSPPPSPSPLWSQTFPWWSMPSATIPPQASTCFPPTTWTSSSIR